MDRSEHALLGDVINGLILEPALVASVLHVVLQPLASNEPAALDRSSRSDIQAALDATASLIVSQKVTEQQVSMLFEPIRALGIDGVGAFAQTLAEHSGATRGLFSGSVREQLRSKLDIIVTTLAADRRYVAVLEEFAALSAEAILNDFARTNSESYAANLLYTHESLLHWLSSKDLKRKIAALDAVVAYS